MGRIDLHAHTEHSDGTLTPTELVRHAAEVGLEALAVTDHDITTALAEAREAGAGCGVEVLGGCEISVAGENGAMHVLAWAFDETDADLQAFLAEVRAGRDARNERMFDRLAELGMPLTEDAVRRHVRGRIMARPHFAQALAEAGHVKDVREAFERWLHDGGPAYVEAPLPPPEPALEVVRAAGGVTAVAHPRQLRLEGTAAWRALFRRLKDAGLTGIEVDHPSHREHHRRRFGRLAEEFDLVPTGGSDFHGTNKPHIALGVGDGTIDVRRDTWERLLERRRS